MKRVFVTVGTTKFPQLIDTITKLDVIEALKKLGYSNIQIQTGRSFNKVNIDPDIVNVLIKQGENSWTVELADFNISIQYDHYFEKFEEEVEKADLVISHAGAGSCLSALKANKPLIVVINNNLMNNHQTELAYQLEADGHLYCCFSNSLRDTLIKDFSVLKSYPKPSNVVFSNYLDRCCGFVQ